MPLKAFCITLGLLLSGLVAHAEPPIPIVDGTTWHYAINDEPGGPGARTVRIAGTEKFEGKTLLKFETLSGDQVTKTELMSVDDRGVMCFARTGRDGVLAKLEPPELIVPGALKVGGSFDVEGDVAGVKSHQHFTVVAEENVLVPAGSLRAFHVHCDAYSLISIAIDRWFAPGIGIVKDLTTVRGPSGGLLQRTTMELKERPEVIARATPTPTATATPTPIASPSPTATPAAVQPPPTTTPVATPPAMAFPPALSPALPEGKRLIVEVSSDPTAGMQTEFHSDVEKVYVRWRGHGLPEGARIRVAWVAEDVGDIVEPNFIVDQTETEAPSPDSSARFTLGRPEDGWAEGFYRVEFYIDNKLEETIKVKILK